MSELPTSVEELKALRDEATKLLRKQRDATKRSQKSPVRLGETKAGEQALLVSPPGRRGAPTRVTRDVAQVLLSSDWAEIAADFAQGEELDPTLFQAEELDGSEEE